MHTNYEPIDPEQNGTDLNLTQRGLRPNRVIVISLYLSSRISGFGDRYVFTF